MLLDPWILYLGVPLAFSVALNLVFGAAIRRFMRSFSDIPAAIQRFVDGFLWEETEEAGEDGVKRVVRKPSKAFVAQLEGLAAVATPILVKYGLEYAKTHIKLNVPGGGGGGGIGDLLGAGGGLGKALGLKGGMGKIVDAFGPGLLQKFLPGLLGQGGGAVTGGTAPLASSSGLLKELPK